MQVAWADLELLVLLPLADCSWDSRHLLALSEEEIRLLFENYHWMCVKQQKFEN